MVVNCPAGCGWDGERLESHYHHSEWCRPVEVQDAPANRARGKASLLFKNRLVSLLATLLRKGHYDMFIKVEHLQMMLAMLVSVVLLFLEYMASQKVAATLCAELRDCVLLLPSAERLVAIGKRQFLRIEPLTFPCIGTKKDAVFFSVAQLVTVMLQECTYVREKTIQQSEVWKEGKLYGTVPAQYEGLESGSAFRSNHAMCGKATADEANDLRVVLHGWTDGFTTTDGLGVTATDHHYDVILAALVNLELRVRHYVDHVLMLALWAVQFAKDNGGMSRMLTGVGVDGVPHHDGVTLAGELDTGREGGVMIDLPDDTAESGLRKWRLRIYMLLFSLDWLAAGAFGPFASSVSARRPCVKCKWTSACPCAFLPASVAAQDRFKGPDGKMSGHSLHCRRNAPRTHAGVMEAVHELRAWKGTKTALAARKTETGIFSAWFASERILPDIVRDSTLDTMHLAFCGMSRYLLSWLTDILIPTAFSWEELNAAKNRHRFGAGVRVPDLKRSKKTTRGSASLKLNAAACMYFTLASVDILEPLVVAALMQAHPAWLTWIAHVRVVSFLVHHSYDAATAGAAIDALVEAFDAAFQTVKEWKGYEKPKMHPFRHLSTSLAEFGPWRGFWCLPWESFLQVLKRMFEMTNYKSAPYTVALFWAVKAVMHYRDRRRVSWYEDSCELASNDLQTNLLELAATSKLIAACLEQPLPVCAIHLLKSVTRGPDSFRIGDWVLVQLGDQSRISRIADMLQAHVLRELEYCLVVRMWCDSCVEPKLDTSGKLWSDKPNANDTMLVCLEDVHVSVVTRNQLHTHDTYSL